MTKLLDKAIAKLKTLPDDQQDALAGLLLDEVSWELHDFGSDGSKLKGLAFEALEEYRKGKTKDWGK